MSLPRKPKAKNSSVQSGPERVLVECSPHRSTGGLFVEGLTPFDIQHESHNEKHCMRLLPLCRDVLEIKSQATQEPYWDESGVQRHHTPDFTVQTPKGIIYLEIKSLSWLTSDQQLNKNLSIGRGYLLQKKRLAFLVDAQLQQQPLFSNVNLLRRYIHCDLAPATYIKLAQQLSDGPKAIADILANTTLQLVDIYAAVARKQICFDLEKLLDRNSIISLPDQPYEGFKLENILSSTRYGGFLAEMALGRRPADQSILADAAHWRQLRQSPSPFQFVGGFTAGSPLRDLRAEESVTRKSWHRRHFAPGAQSIKTDHG